MSNKNIYSRYNILLFLWCPRRFPSPAAARPTQNLIIVKNIFYGDASRRAAGGQKAVSVSAARASPFFEQFDERRPLFTVKLTRAPAGLRRSPAVFAAETVDFRDFRSKGAVPKGLSIRRDLYRYKPVFLAFLSRFPIKYQYTYKSNIYGKKESPVFRPGFLRLSF